VKYEGILLKMKSDPEITVRYHLPVGKELVYLNDLIGKELKINYLGEIHCIKCGRLTKTSFAQGYCYPCFISAPETSECVLRPELCRAHEGISRDMEWSKEHCLQDHIVYLAITSGLKVGVTRISQVPARWIDQGAVAVIHLAQTPNRYTAGIIEVALKEFMNDRTNWRNMLTGKISGDVDLVKEKGRAGNLLQSDLRELISDNNQVIQIHYPVTHYPEKVKSLILDKTSAFSGVLQGIKGQYLIFRDNTVFNVRNHSGYLVQVYF
jgi:hypothetical protein